MNHFKAYLLGFERGVRTNTLYEWVGDSRFEESFRKGNIDGIDFEGDFDD